MAMTVEGLAFMFSSSILLHILACAIYINWWPLLSGQLVAAVWMDAAKFFTGASAMGSMAIPIILRHAGLIEQEL